MRRSLEYPRSHTDPLANLVVLSALDIRRNLQDILNRDLPIQSLPTLVHEVTHHWCFDSPVGVALHLLFMRARRAAWLALEQDHGQDESWDVLDTVLRYETALRIVRPLSEGAALFAEHDVIPGSANTISTPMLVTAGLYGNAYALKRGSEFSNLATVLAAARVSRTHVRRKADLLIQPMTCSGGGYLPGYLMVKTLWESACAASELFLDSDFFLQYLRSHLFDDWELVSVLLDDSKRDISALDPIQEHMANRLREFVQSTITGQRPREFEKTFENGELPKLRIRTPVLEFDVPYSPLDQSDSADLGRTRLKKGMEEYFDTWPEDSGLKGLMRQDASELAVRPIVNIGHATLDARPAEGGLELLANGELLCSVNYRHVPEADRAAGSVEIDIFMIPIPGALCVSLMRGKSVFSLFPIGDYEIPHDLSNVLMDRHSRASFVELSQKMIDEALVSARLDYILEHTRKAIDDRLTGFLVPIALMGVGDDALGDVMQETEADGLLPILEDDVDLVLDAAAASLCMASPYNIHALDSFHRWSKDSAESSIRRVNELIAAKLGKRPVLTSNGLGVPCI